MIKGLGIDVAEVDRIAKNIDNERFLNKIFSKNEQEYLNTRKFNPQTAAGMFAAKEAVAKCLGTGFSNFGPCHIEILKNDIDKPYVSLLGNALAKAQELEISIIHVSISHTHEIATAFCIAE